MAEKKLEEHSVRRFSENAGRGREGGCDTEEKIKCRLTKRRIRVHT